MILSSDRLAVVESERIRIVLLVTTAAPLVDLKGGLPYLAHAIEDIGFRDVTVTDEPPPWGTDYPKPLSLDWLVWVEATPVRSASLSRSLTSELEVLDAFAVRGEAPPSDGSTPAAVFAHPYAIVCFLPVSVLGLFRVFGVAYPVSLEASC